jgi:hypothetical protein
LLHYTQMNEILHANIFFLIASAATVCFSVLVCIALYHLIKIMKSIRVIIARVEEGTAVLADDIDALRATFLHGNIFSRLFRFFAGGGMSEPVRRRSRSTSKKIIKSYGNKEDDEQSDDDSI